LRQAQVAERLGISRPTVSKLLAEARRIGMVRIEVLDPPSVDLAELASQVRALLGIDKVLIAPGDQRARDYRGLADLLGEELHDLNLRRGDVLLISSGTTTHAVSRIPSLPELPGVVVAPTIGGQQEPDPTFQTNEIVRTFADRTGAQPQFIFAPALPSPSLWASLQADPSFQEITELWARARVLVTGIGAPYDDRAAMTSVVPREDPGLQGSAGDVCLYSPWSRARTPDCRARQATCACTSTTRPAARSTSRAPTGCSAPRSRSCARSPRRSRSRLTSTRPSPSAPVPARTSSPR